MATVDYLGTEKLVGGQAVIHGTTITFTNYIVESSEDGGKNSDFEDIYLASGARAARLVFNRNQTVTLNLISLGASRTTTNIRTDFPEGRYCTLTGLTTWIVNSAKLSLSKSAIRVAVTLSRDFKQDATA